jgi:propanediol dehydratase small subunit
LVIIGPPSRRLLASYDSARPDGGRASQEKLLQFFDHLSCRFRAGQQSDDVRFNGVKADRMIDLLAMLER